ncbi:MAG: phosphonate C-P lyase system protein PhnH, partial [Paracoccaceae bacterium]|nr:phosphonate C-P lyase system protein PhnH [Paracoccaceae bacterium]
MMTTLDLPALWRPETHQALFRLILDATARPGTLADISTHLSGETAALAVLACFCDNTQSLADLTGTIDATARNFLDTPKTAADQAAFVLADGAAAPGFTPRLGTLDLPDGGATLVLQVAHLGAGQALRLSGPGIKDTTTLHVSGLHA